MIEKPVSHGLLHVFSHLSFFSGIASLVPTMTETLRSGIAPWKVLPPMFYIGAFLIFLSLIILVLVKRSISGVFISIGTMLLIVGGISLIFGVFGQEQVFNTLSSKISGFSFVEPTARFFVEHSVPKVLFIGIVYLFFGYLSLRLGLRLQRGI